MAIEMLPIVRCIFSSYIQYLFKDLLPLQYLSCWYSQEVVYTKDHVPFHIRYLNAHISAWCFICNIFTEAKLEIYEKTLSTYVGIFFGIVTPLVLFILFVYSFQEIYEEFFLQGRITFLNTQYRNIPKGYKRLTHHIEVMYELNERAKTVGYNNWDFTFLDAYQVRHVGVDVAWDLIKQRQRLSEKLFEVHRDLAAYGFPPRRHPSKILRAARRSRGVERYL